MKVRVPKPLNVKAPVVTVNFIFLPDKSRLTLVGCQLATYLVCSAVASSPRSKCEFELTSEQLATATGYSSRHINRALQKLEDTGYIIKKSPYLPMYELGSPNIIGVKRALAGDKKATLRTVLIYNRMAYLQLPLELFTQLPRMSNVELQATIVMLQRTAYSRSLTTTAAEWARQANIANTRDLYAVVEKMAWCSDIEQVGRNFYIQRTDPDRRKERLDREMAREIAKNHAPEKERPYTSEVLFEWLTALGVRSLPGCANSDLRIFCPSCRELKPSLSINLEKGDLGVFYCHSCGFGKHMVVPHLLDKLNIPRKTYKNKLKEISARTK
jgi:hypothetical protein